MKDNHYIKPHGQVKKIGLVKKISLNTHPKIYDFWDVY